jgi:hypothetical protein
MSSEKSSFKVFFLGTAKIGLAIFIAVIALAMVGVSIGFIYKHIESAKNKSLIVVKYWPQINISPLKNAKFDLTTKWQDSIVYYKFSMSDYPTEKENDKYSDKINSPYHSTKGALTIILLDDNGFKIRDKQIEFNKMTRTIDNDGKLIGLSVNDSFYMSADDYRKIKYWEITWYF